ncbi:MAG: hypothetical protein EA382_09775, partial [Spirochaetaceae bacterium]
HREAGSPDDALRWDRVVDRITPMVRNAAWSDADGLYLEGPGRTADRLSQHSQVLAILSGVATDPQIARITDRLFDNRLIPMKLMQSFYLARALEQVGAYEAFHTNVLSPWRAMRELNLSTCAEYLPGRSDCHAWSSWPAVDFVRTVLGVRPGTPGFATIDIAPQTDGLTHARGGIVSPAGRIDVEWRRDGAIVSVSATVPKGVPTRIALPGGKRTFERGGRIEFSA